MFVRHVFQLGLANVAAQVLSLLAVPLLTRLYSPTDYGAFATYLALLNTLVPVASLRYHAALVLPKTEEERGGLFFVALLVTACTSGTLLLLIVVAQSCGWAPAGWERVATPLLWLLPVNVAAGAMTQLFSSRLMARQEVRATANGHITESLCDRGISCLAGATGSLQAAGLALGRLLGASIAALYLWKAILSRAALRAPERAEGLGGNIPLEPRRSNPGPTWRGLAALAGRYRHFALVSSWAALCDAAARQAPAIILALWFSPVIAGYYMLAFQVVNVPILIAGDALAGTFFQRAAAARDRPEQLAEDSLKLLHGLLCVIIPSTLLLVFLGQPAFRLFFGPSWERAGVFAELLAVGFLFMFVHRPLSVLFDVLQAQTARLRFDAMNLILRAAVMIGLARLSFGPEAVLLGFTITSVSVYGLGLLYLLRTVGIPLQHSLGVLAKGLGLFLPFAAALWILLSLERFPQIGLLLLLAALGLQTFLLLRFDKQTRQRLALLIPRRP
jgi:lipopolysaccharide exporter